MSDEKPDDQTFKLKEKLNYFTELHLTRVTHFLKAE